MECYSTHLDESRGEISRQGDAAKGKGGAEVPGPSSIPHESLAENTRSNAVPLAQNLRRICLRHPSSRLYISVGRCLCPRALPRETGDGVTVSERRRRQRGSIHQGTIPALVIGLPVDCIEFPRDRAATTWNRPLGHHMPSVRSSLSGPGLGSGWPPRYPTPTAAPRQCGWVWDGATLRSAGAPRGHGSGGSDGGSRQFVSTTSVSGEGSVERAMGIDISDHSRDLGNGTPWPRLGGWGNLPRFRGVATGVGGVVELTQLQAGKGGVLSCILWPDAT